MGESLKQFLPVPSNAGIKTIMAAIVVAISQILGGWSPAMGVLITIMALDVVSGVFRTALHHELSSGEMIARGIKKILIWGLVALGAQLDLVIGGDGHLLRDGIVIYYLVAEAMSVLENTAACGLPYPEWLLTALKQLNERKAQPKI
jgi:toxin secretion/phage lysis holin